MAESEVFDWVADELTRRTDLTRLEARGTLRLVVKDAGLDPTTVAAFQMDIVLKRLMPAALAKRRVEGAAETCQALAEDLSRSKVAHSTPSSGDTAYDVFERFDGGRPRRKKP